LDVGLEIPIAVNLSAFDVQEAQMPTVIADLLGRWNVPARLLTVEITEGALLADPALALRPARSGGDSSGSGQRPGSRAGRELARARLPANGAPGRSPSARSARGDVARETGDLEAAADLYRRAADFLQDVHL